MPVLVHEGDHSITYYFAEIRVLDCCSSVLLFSPLSQFLHCHLTIPFTHTPTFGISKSKYLMLLSWQAADNKNTAKQCAVLNNATEMRQLLHCSSCLSSLERVSSACVVISCDLFKKCKFLSSISFQKQQSCSSHIEDSSISQYKVNSIKHPFLLDFPYKWHGILPETNYTSPFQRLMHCLGPNWH